MSDLDIAYEKGRAAAFRESARVARDHRIARPVASGVKQLPATPMEIAQILEDRANAADRQSRSGR